MHPIFQISPNGYLPLKGGLDRMKIKERNDKNEYTFDTLKLSYFESLIRESKDSGIKLVIVASPIWYGREKAQFEPLLEICSQEGIPFYNYSNDDVFVRNDELFKDGTHLNDHGADEFTKIMAYELKKKGLLF